MDPATAIIAKSSVFGWLGEISTPLFKKEF